MAPVPSRSGDGAWAAEVPTHDDGPVDGQSAPAAGWFEDPGSPGALRWWDGTRWTAVRSESGRRIDWPAVVMYVLLGVIGVTLLNLALGSSTCDGVVDQDQCLRNEDQQVLAICAVLAGLAVTQGVIATTRIRHRDRDRSGPVLCLCAAVLYWLVSSVDAWAVAVARHGGLSSLGTGGALAEVLLASAMGLGAGVAVSSIAVKERGAP